MLATALLALGGGFGLSHLFALRIAEGIARALPWLAVGTRPALTSGDSVSGVDVSDPQDGGTREVRDGGVRTRRANPKSVVVHVGKGARDEIASAHVIAVTDDDVRRVFGHGVPDVEATPAVDERGEPLGVLLRGVSRYKVPLRDGDVVTSIDGRPLHDAEGGVVAAGAVLARADTTAVAELLRDGKLHRVIVRIPPEYRGEIDGGAR